MPKQEIIDIANELTAKGITPTSAMIKARLSQNVPMAQLLSILSQWKQQPSPSTSPNVPIAGSAATPTLEQLSKQLNRIEQKIDALSQLLQSSSQY